MTNQTQQATNKTFGITFDSFQDVIDTLEALPSNQSSVTDNQDAFAKINPAFLTAGKQDKKENIGSYTLFALQSMVGYAGFKVAITMNSMYETQKNLQREENSKSPNPDVLESRKNAISRRLDIAEKWLSLHEYLSDKLQHRFDVEGVKAVDEKGNPKIRPIVPFDIDMADVVREMHETGTPEKADEVYDRKVKDRENVIQLIKGLNPATDCGDDVRFEITGKLMQKLAKYSGRMNELKNENVDNDQFSYAIENNIKEKSIDAVIKKINSIDMYELVIDKDDTVH